LTWMTHRDDGPQNHSFVSLCIKFGWKTYSSRPMRVLVVREY
jgi:hypothetical protein